MYTTIRCTIEASVSVPSIQSTDGDYNVYESASEGNCSLHMQIWWVDGAQKTKLNQAKNSEIRACILVSIGEFW